MLKMGPFAIHTFRINDVSDRNYDKLVLSSNTDVSEEGKKAVQKQIEKVNNILNQQKDLTEDYYYWYEVFVKKIQRKHDQIIEFADEETYKYVYNIYTNILNSIKAGYLGGVVLYAKTKCEYL